METSKRTRREILSSLAIGSGAATIGGALGSMSHAQESILTAMEVREFHRSQLNRASEMLDGNLALSQAGLDEACDALAQEELISDEEAATLKQLVGEVLDLVSGDAETLQVRVEQIYNGVINGLGSVARTIAAILMDSVEHALEILQDFDFSIVQLVIAHDVRGALDGAMTGAQLGERFRFAPVPLAVACAVGSGVSSSIIGFYDMVPRNT